MTYYKLGHHFPPVCAAARLKRVRLLSEEQLRCVKM
jgi:hypothetical protein